MRNFVASLFFYLGIISSILLSGIALFGLWIAFRLWIFLLLIFLYIPIVLGGLVIYGQYEFARIFLDFDILYSILFVLSSYILPLLFFGLFKGLAK